MGNSHSSFSTGHNRGVTPFSIEKAILLAPLFPHSPFSIIPFCILRGVTTPNIWKLTTQIGLYHPKGIVCVSLMWSHLRPMVVTRVSVDYDIYLKNRLNQKRKGSDCWARRALFVLEWQQFLRLWVLFRECVIGQCAWARARGMSVWGPLMGDYFFEEKLEMDSCLETPSTSATDSSFWRQRLCVGREFPLWRLLWKID